MLKALVRTLVMRIISQPLVKYNPSYMHTRRRVRIRTSLAVVSNGDYQKEQTRLCLHFYSTFSQK